MVTKRKHVTKQGFCKILWRKLHLRRRLLLVLIHFCWAGGERGLGFGCGHFFEFEWKEEGVGAYWFFSTFRVGTNSRLGAYLNKYSVCFYQILQRGVAAVDGYDTYFTRFRWAWHKTIQPKHSVQKHQSFAFSNFPYSVSKCLQICYPLKGLVSPFPAD